MTGINVALMIFDVNAHPYHLSQLQLRFWSMLLGATGSGAAAGWLSGEYGTLQEALWYMSQPAFLLWQA